MPELVITLTDREWDALAELRRLGGFASSADTGRAGLYKLAAWYEPDVDTTLFALRDGGGGIPRTSPPREREPEGQPDLFEAEP